ncbi:MAG: hypothetical protein ACLP7P_09090 [Rhodomicrobium sp.]
MHCGFLPHVSHNIKRAGNRPLGNAVPLAAMPVTEAIMLLTAEIRWFWLGAPQADFEKWFCETARDYCGAGGGGERSDSYIWDPGQVELGIKLRNGALEVKGLVEISRSQVSFTPKLTGRVELWCKWRTETLQLVPRRVIAVKKRRWLRQFYAADDGPSEIALDESEKPKGVIAPPARGCNIELSRVRDDGGRIWWSFGFESFGALADIEDMLQATVALMLERGPPPLPPGLCASYPKWLSEKQFL